LDFADYRNYTPGDNLRQVDWNVYARSDRAYIKLFQEQQDLAVHLLIDASRSMEWGQGEANKWLYARKLVLVLTQIALTMGDEVQIAALPSAGENRGALWGPVRGPGQVMRVARWLQSRTTEGTTHLEDDMKTWAAGSARAGLVILVSDLLSPGSFSQGLSHLLARGHECMVVQILAAEELAPAFVGDFQLRDIETGQTQQVTVDRKALALYAEHLNRWLQAIRTDCEARAVPYALADTGEALQRFVLDDLRQAGILV
jgi:uncharacterized protein (DUF58 family)